VRSSRRGFVAATAAGWLASQIAPPKAPIRGNLVGASREVGHLLRDGAAKGAVRSTERAEVVVVGGGVSGLSAAWRLRGAGVRATIVDLEPFVGGTSAWGEDGVVPHPWGAHYLPAPNLEARPALKLLADMGVLTHFDAAGRPVFDPMRLCHAPQERLFYRGAWHVGLAPKDALDDAEVAELVRFEALMDELEEKRGVDGRFWFTIPVELSSRDPEALALDRRTFAEWLELQGFSGRFLRWFARYATLDDFGAEPDAVSAWAGIHYFTARKEESEALAGSRFLVWPEGNGRLARALLEASEASYRTRLLALAIEEEPEGARVRALDVERGEVVAIDARAVVVATPAFVARRLHPGAAALPRRVASPWVVANLHVERPLDPSFPWDSVLYDGDGLGYVDAAHQAGPPSDKTVLTYFRAYGAADAARARADLARASWSELASGVFADLAPAHPDLPSRTDRIDVMVWGHAMPRPSPGFLGERPFAPVRALGPRTSYGHVDLPGMALFEEAQRAGVLAAERALEALGAGPVETWA
jgi:predicted NAD/FAD-dependent oxidoreductase